MWAAIVSKWSTRIRTYQTILVSAAFQHFLSLLFFVMTTLKIKERSCTHGLQRVKITIRQML